MPRRKLARRFEPRFGVSQVMLDEEAQWVKRELEDHLLLSTTDLRKNLSELRMKLTKVEENLRSILGRLPDRERLALQGMLARDAFHLASLYETFLRASNLAEQATGVKTPVEEEKSSNDEPPSALLFQKSLFD